jgi:hypothetical protein
MVKTKNKKKVVKKKVKDVEFSFCIGRPWHPENPHSSICTYTYGTTVFHGTMKDAKGMKKFIEGRCEDKQKYEIYKLVKID